MSVNKGFPYPLRDISEYTRYRHRRHTNDRTISKEFISLSDFQFYFSYLFSNENDSIIKEAEKKLSENKNNLIYWTTETMAKLNVGFMFYNSYNSTNYNNEEEKDSKMAVKIIRLAKSNDTEKIIDNVVNMNDFNSAKAIINNFYILHYTPTNYQFRLLNAIPNNNSINNFIVLKSWEETLKFLIINDNLTNEVIFSEDYSEQNWELLNEFYMDYSKTMLNENKKLDKIKYNVIDVSNNLRTDISVRHIIKVMETRINETNYRIFLFAKFERYSGIKYGVGCLTEKSRYYNYIDDDRLYFYQQFSHNFYFLDNGLNTTSNGKLHVVLDMFHLISERIRQILGNDNFVINASTYRFFYERYKHLMVDKNTDTKDEIELILDKYVSVLQKNKELKLDSILISKTKIEIPDQQFNMTFDANFIDLTDKKILNEIRAMSKNDDVKYNFNTFYERILRLSALKIVIRDNVRDEDYKDFKSAKFTLNGMTIEVSKDARVRINDVYCRIEDVFEILNRAICYTSQDDYERYIKDVSFIGYKWKAMIGTGSIVKLYNPFAGINQSFGDITLRFSYYWDTRRRSRIYLSLNDERYEINGKYQFLKHFNMPEQYLTIEEIKTQLLDSIQGVNSDEIIEIIKNAVKEGEIVRKKAEELVSRTVTDIGAEKVEILIRGAKKIGYIFKGRITNAEFFVDAQTLDVFKKVNDEWNRRCVVNDSNKNRIFEDWLANRLVNVFNEPSYIHTLHNI